MKNNSGLIFLGIGFELLGIVIGALIIGSVIDEELDSGRLATMILFLLGMAGWMFHLIVLLNRFMKQSEREQRSKVDKEGPSDPFTH